MSETKPPAEGLKVFISTRDSKCDDCGEELGRKAWITLDHEKGALCLSCGDLDQLVFLPSGDAALTRRSKKHSSLSAVVLKWSRTSRRYERQGLLVQDSALEQAERECLADTEARARRAERERERRGELDHEYISTFAVRVRELFPNCPPEREHKIAEHACRKYSGRVGRTQAAKDLEVEAVTIAVIAHIRHRETNYDELLFRGWHRSAARGEVRDEVDEVLNEWR
ncbi:MAG TPA: DUF2293 domain-containing protein [Pyrinomonadaceae bacterium]|nr:DUF2293 domain-containing protein [Pyrinomonadaceae bacterium]